jgi:hypothetical protein
MQLFHARTASPSFRVPSIDLNSPLTHFVTFCVNLLRPWSPEDDTLARHECHAWGDSTERQVNDDIMTERRRGF